MPTYQEGNIECPFYICQDNNCIYCESYVKEVRRNNLTFRSSDVKKKYINTYCVVNGGKGCVHYKILNYLYETGVLK